MNKQYLTNFYEKNKKELSESEQGINSLENLIDYIHSTLSSNIQYDFNLDIDMDQLFEENTNSLNPKEEEVEYEKD